MIPERRRATLYLVLIFFCGGLSGAVAANLWQRVTVSAQSNMPGASSISSGKKRPVEWFKEKLELSPEQTEKLTQVLDETHYAYKLREQEIDSIRSQGNARIREILKPEQRPKFDQMIARSNERRSNNRKNHD